MTFAIGPGDVLAGKYRVERVVGKGGMGMVVAAMHLQLDKRVALKFLLPEVAQNPELVARFGREARAAGKIESEHVAKVLDVGTLDGGAPFMVMEYLEGSDLAKVVKTRGALPGQEAIDYVLQACEALAEAHVAGIVHRDLKPANLFLTKRADGSACIKVLDFGISKIALAGDGEQGMTQTSAMMGSPNYMAPEQLKSARNVDPRTDIWALGMVLYELLTGEVAFKAETVPELYVHILQSPPTPLRARRPDAPPQMEAIVLRCLEKEPARRFANVAELAAALGELAPQARASVERITRVIATQKPPPGKAGHTFAMGPQAALNPGGLASRALDPAPAGPAHAGNQTPPPGQSPFSGPSQRTPQHGSMPQQQAYGPQGHYGYGHPQHHPNHQTFGPQPSPFAGMGSGPAQPQGMSAATIALIALIAVIVLGGGSCVACYCLGTLGQDARRHELDADPISTRAIALGGPAGLSHRGAWSSGSGTKGDARAAVRPFQRPAGWTTVCTGASSLPLLGHVVSDPVQLRSGRRGRARALPRNARRG
jgi:serine/threonine-protein kinase